MPKSKFIWLLCAHFFLLFSITELWVYTVRFIIWDYWVYNGEKLDTIPSSGPDAITVIILFLSADLRIRAVGADEMGRDSN